MINAFFPSRSRKIDPSFSCIKVKSVPWPMETERARMALISGSCSVKRLDTSPSQVYPQHFVGLSLKQFAASHLYTCTEKGTVKVKFIA